MGLIKAEVAPAARISSFSMAESEQPARAILLRARAKSDQVLREAQVAAEESCRNAHAEGLAAGYDEGLEKGTEEGGKLGREQALTENRVQMAEAVAALTAAT